MFQRFLSVFAVIVFVSLISHCGIQKATDQAGYVGSSNCRSCHEHFYQLWATSRHGKAMQKVTKPFVEENLVFDGKPISIGDYTYVAQFNGKKAWIVEKNASDQKRYEMLYAVGGKNIYFFLTPLEKGRLQVLPLAFDVKSKKWYNTTQSMVRHAADLPDAPIDWREPALTFNTSCYSCHVSQLQTNYDLESDSYHTTWTEPGINCETCHGASAEHIKVCRNITNEKIPSDLKIIRTKYFSNQQTNSSCSSCHAKMRPLTQSYKPGDEFFNHFDLITLEDHDFYPDGRDLGENYTYTSWRMSPCAKSGQLSCLHCHTSSGRFRFKNEPNQACMPCHKERVENVEAHSHHKKDSEGSKCIACHMPMTEFAKMKRTDHSMLPPTPATTIAYNSPNACNICHKEKTAAWADSAVRKWHKKDYQASKMHLAGLIAAARKEDWSKLNEMLDYIKSTNHDEIFTTSLIRLLRRCPNPEKWPVIKEALNDPSPLVRSSAAEVLEENLTPQNVRALTELLNDSLLLVRYKAMRALSRIPKNILERSEQLNLDKAFAEYEKALKVRLDSWISHYNLGNFYLNQQRFNEAVQSYNLAIKLNPNEIMPLINLSIAYNRLKQNDKAEQALRKALAIDPQNYAAYLNLGMLLAEMGRKNEAVMAFKKALEINPQSAQAAYNLAVLYDQEGLLNEAVKYSSLAAELDQQDPKYLYSYAFFLQKAGNKAQATEVLEKCTQKFPAYGESYLLLGYIWEQQGKEDKAVQVYGAAIERDDLDYGSRRRILAKLNELTNRTN